MTRKWSSSRHTTGGGSLTKFTVVPGVPDMQAEWNRLMRGLTGNTLDQAERAHAKKLAKAVRHLEDNPAHPGLQSHEIEALSARYGLKVYESYLENKKPGAARIFWVYGPERHYITVIGMEPHPEDAKRDAYARVQLSQLPRIQLASTVDRAPPAKLSNPSAGRKPAARRSRKRGRQPPQAYLAGRSSPKASTSPFKSPTINSRMR